jgi:hypothetical protein
LMKILILWFFDVVVVAHVEPITPAELYSQMLSHELHHGHQSTDGNLGSYSSANAIVRGCGGPGRFSKHGCGRGCGRGAPGCSSEHAPNNNNSRSPASRSGGSSNG